MSRRRVVITGMGVVTPLGCSIHICWDGLITGRSGIGPLQNFECTDYETRFSGECREFDPLKWIDGKLVKRMDPFAQFATASAIDAMNDSGLDVSTLDPYRIGVI